MKKMLGILLLVVTLLSGITVLAGQDNKKSGGNEAGHGHGRRHHRRHHRWARRHGRRHATGNANKH